MSWYEIVATWFWCGRVPKIPGTVGSIAALAFFPVVVRSYHVGMLLFFALFLLGTKATEEYLALYPSKQDPREVVVDEVCGQLLVFVIVVALGGYGFMNIVADTLWGMWGIALGGLAAFRMYDSVKPWPICVADKNVHGAFGVMLDDIAAAVPAAIVTLASISASIMLS